MTELELLFLLLLELLLLAELDELFLLILELDELLETCSTIPVAVAVIQA